MSSFIQKALLQTQSPIFQFKRFRGKINIQRPRAPHYERAKMIAVTTPVYKPQPNNRTCFERPQQKATTNVENPYNSIIAKEVHNWFNHSKMVALFHMNSITADDIFGVQVALHKKNMHLKSYGSKMMHQALTNSKYEAVIPLFDSKTYIVFSTEQEQVSQLLKLTKKVPQMILLAGIVQNRLLSRNEFMKYANLPGLEAARAQFVMTLNMGAGQVVENLETHQKLLCNALDTYAKSGGEGPAIQGEMDSEEGKE